MMVVEDLGQTQPGKLWSQSASGDHYAGEPSSQQRYSSPNKPTTNSSNHFLVPLTNAAIRRASHCSGLTSIDGRLAKPQAGPMRGASFRRRHMTDCQGSYDTNPPAAVSRVNLLRSSVDRGVQFAPDSDEDSNHAAGHSYHNHYRRRRGDRDDGQGGDSSSRSGSECDSESYSNPAGPRLRLGSVTGVLHLPALPHPAGPGGALGAAASSGGAGSFIAGAGAGAGGAATAGPTGVTLAFLESLRDASRPGATLRDVFRTVVLPASRSARCAYVHLLGAGGDFRGRPTHVLVCSWDERVSDVVDLLADFAAANAAAAAAAAGPASSPNTGAALAAPGHSPQASPGGGGSPLGPGPQLGFSDATARTVRRRSAVYGSLDLGSGAAGAGGDVGGGGGATGPLVAESQGSPAATPSGSAYAGASAAPAAASYSPGTVGGSTTAAASLSISPPPPFAVWLDLFAVNFHLPAAPQSPIMSSGAAAAAAAASAAASAAAAAAAAASAFGTVSRLPPTMRQSQGPSLELAFQERTRALPAAIASTRAVLLLPGAQGAALRETPCMVGVWHALRGRGCAGGTSLTVVAPPHLDMGLVQAAFEGLAVSSRAQDDQGNSSGGSGGGSGAAGGGGSGGSADGLSSAAGHLTSQMSPERMAMRAMREGATVNSAAVNAAIYAADPLPSRTVREGVTAAAVASATALLSRPVGTGGGGPIAHAMSASVLLPTPPALGPHTVLSGRSSSVNTLEAPQPPPSQPPPQVMLSPLSSSRLALLPSPLRNGSPAPGSPSGGRGAHPGAVGEAWIQPHYGTGGGDGGGGGGGGRWAPGGGPVPLLRPPSGRSMSFTNLHGVRAAGPGGDVEDDEGPCSAGAVTTPAGGGHHGIQHLSLGGVGGASGGRSRVLGGGTAAAEGPSCSLPPPPAAAASDNGSPLDSHDQSARRMRILAPLLDVSGDGYAGGGSGSGASPSRLQQLRRTAQAPWESAPPLPTATTTSIGSPRLLAAPGLSAVALLGYSESAGGGGGSDSAGDDAVSRACGPSLSGGLAPLPSQASVDSTTLSLPLPKFSQLLTPHLTAAGAALPPAVAAITTAAVSAPLPQLQLPPHYYHSLGSPSVDGGRAASLAEVEEEDGMPSPFGQRRRGVLHGLPPRCAHHNDESSDELELDVVDATASIAYDSDGDRPARSVAFNSPAPPSKASLLQHTRSSPQPDLVSIRVPHQPSLPSALLLPSAGLHSAVAAAAGASPKPLPAASGSARQLPSPLSPPLPPPHPAPVEAKSSPDSLGGTPAAQSPSLSSSSRPLAAELARLVAAARLLAALGQASLALRLARHAYISARAMHGFNNADTARCAAALAVLAHHFLQTAPASAAAAPAAPPPLKSGGGGLRGSVAAAAAVGTCSGAASPRCMSPARSRLALNSNDVPALGPAPPSGDGPLSGGAFASPFSPSPPPQPPLSPPLSCASPVGRGRFAGGGGGTAGSTADGSSITPAAVSAYCEDVEGFLRGASVVLERFLGADHEEAVSARQSLAAVMASSGRHEEAIAVLQRAVGSREGHRRHPCEAVLGSCLDLGACLAAVGRQREARQLLKAQLVKLEEEEDEAAAVAAASVMAARNRAAATAAAAAAAAAMAVASGAASPTGVPPQMGALAPPGLASGSGSTQSLASLPLHYHYSSHHHQDHHSHNHNHHHNHHGVPLQLQLPSARSLGPLAAASASGGGGGGGGGADSPLLRAACGGSGGGGGSAAGSAAHSGCTSPGSPAQAAGQGLMLGSQTEATAAAGPGQGLTTLKRAELRAKCAHQLAQLKASAGKSGVARRLYRRAIEDYSVAYGSRHAVTAGAMLALAALCHTAQEYGEALDLYRAVLELYVELYGPHHAATIRVSNRLGAVEEALENERSLLPPPPPIPESAFAEARLR